MVDTNIERKRARDTAWQQNNRGRMRNLVLLRRQDMQDQFFEMYGGVCACPDCNESNRWFLTLDHINNDGHIERSKYGAQRKYGNYNTYKKATDEYRPDLFQCQCFNCNCGSGINNGVCPHILDQHSRRSKFLQFLETYGTSCACCGENNVGFLTLDHINNDGFSDRIKDSCRLAMSNYRPDLYQTLCYNCNCGKHRNNGVCPHIKVARQRLVRRNKRAKLTVEQVRKIRKECKIGSHTKGISALAKQYKVRNDTVADIVYNRSWKDI